MTIGIHGKKFLRKHLDLIQEVLQFLNSQDCDLVYSEEYAGVLQGTDLLGSDAAMYGMDSKPEGLDIMITLGGDGTLLEAVGQTGNLSVPVLGINIGRLGFLATIARDEVINSLKSLFDGNYTYDERTLLRLHSEKQLFGDKNFALNDFTILKKDTSSMITVHTYLNEEFLNSYWADGLIVSTPTGSTAYSLSCGGPLIMPGSQNFVITPVSPHNLTTRPMVIPDTATLRFKVEGRAKHFLTSLDSRFKTIGLNTELTIEKADFNARLIQFPEGSYFKTIRQKLSWGMDVRN